RVKIGMTSSSISGRLKDVNDMWSGERVTCQICGGRRLKGKYGKVPSHVVSGRPCPGSNTLPFEKDSTVAKQYLMDMKKQLENLSGSELGSMTRKISGIEKRMERFKKFDQLIGDWITNTVYYTNCAELVELRTHEVLAEHLDDQVPFGEVFSCSVSDAIKAVEAVMDELDLLQSARKELAVGWGASRGQPLYLPFH
ncbi:MAG: hypothetical protein KDD58_14475, partial [Bdellovibrionales bacterium]|nr:hypothetical protein [Bdellovibrionales bacterium]